MSEGCIGCNQKLIEANEAKKKIVYEAQALANRDGVWYGIYTDEFGTDQIIRGDLAEKYFIRRYVSPQVQDPSV